MTVAPQAVIVTRPTEYDELLFRHGTRGQVEFFLGERGQTLDELDRRHNAQVEACRQVSRAIPVAWRRAHLDRDDLDRWVFEPDQIIIAVGQDGLVANVAKYLDGQPVIGINPDPNRYPGVLVRHAAPSLAGKLAALTEATPQNGTAPTPGAGIVLERRAMVRVQTDDGQSLRALNELYLGHIGHQSASYRITDPTGRQESQFSSGVIVGTGTGSTGWCRSIWKDRSLAWPLPEPTSTDLAWFVREAWPSATTGATLTAGLLHDDQALQVRSNHDGLVLFGDGIESDRLELPWGQQATISVAPTALHLA